MLKPDRSYRWGMAVALIGFATAANSLITRSWITKSTLSAAFVDLVRHPTSPLGMVFLIGVLSTLVGTYYYLFTPLYYVLDDTEDVVRPSTTEAGGAPPGETLH